MEVEVRFSGNESRNKYKIESFFGTVTISRIMNTTDYSGRSEDVVRTEKITTIEIPYDDLSTLVLSLQKILY